MARLITQEAASDGVGLKQLESHNKTAERPGNHHSTPELGIVDSRRAKEFSLQNSPNKAQGNFKGTSRQRFFKPARDDSLFQPFVVADNTFKSPSKSAVQAADQTVNGPSKLVFRASDCTLKVRATPKRATKKLLNYKDSPGDLIDSSTESEWHASTEDEEEDDEYDEEPESLYPKSGRYPQPIFRSGRTPLGLMPSEGNIYGHTKQREIPSRIPNAPLQDSVFVVVAEESTKPRNGDDIFFDTDPSPSSPTFPRSQPETPPVSPSKSKLPSPRKLHCIPPTPHRPSFDAFWSQDVVNTWNEQYSPQKTLNSPSKSYEATWSDELDDEDSSPVSSPRKARSMVNSPKKDRAALAARKAFDARKQNIADSFFKDLDEKTTGGAIQRLAESTGGVQLIWSKKLNSTAGRANWKREAIKSATQGSCNATFSGIYKHTASIELAEKVIDNEERLLNVLAHEYCHLANFMISNIKDQPHGASFKTWATRVTSAFRHHRGQVDGKPVLIEVTTKHSYIINYKYAWQCTNHDACGVLYERHSRSIDPKRHTCGKCRGRLVQFRPVPKNGAVVDGNDGESTVKRTAYHLFVKENFGNVKRELGPESPHKDVMKELGVRYRESKATPAHETTKLSTVDVIEIKNDDEAGQQEVDFVSRVLDFLTISND